jgi:hypothetical protein
MNKTIVTSWYKWNNNKKEFIFNHYSKGYDEEQEYPISDIPKQQKDWKRSKWDKRLEYLIKRKDKSPLLTEEI